MAGLMLNIFSAMWNNFYNTMRSLSPLTKGLVIFGLIFGAFLCFIFSVKGSKKDKLIKNWFLFFVFILLTILAVLFCFIM